MIVKYYQTLLPVSVSGRDDALQNPWGGGSLAAESISDVWWAGERVRGGADKHPVTTCFPRQNVCMNSSVADLFLKLSWLSQPQSNRELNEMKDLMDTNLFRGRDNCCRGGQPQGVLGDSNASLWHERDKQTRRELVIPAFFLVCRPIFRTLFISPLLPSSDQARAEPNGLSALLATKIFLVVHI